MTERFDTLRIRQSQLCKHFVSGIETIEQDDIGAYVLLVHAEIESYFEGIARDIAVKAVTIWKNNKITSITLVSLVVYSGSSFKKVPTEIIDLTGKDNDSIDNRIDSAMKSFMGYLKDHNHGIKEENLLRLLLPIGVQSNDIDPAWLAEIDQFGKQRGGIAHQSSMKTTTEESPYHEIEKVYNTVENIFSGIQELDNKLDNILTNLTM